MSIGYDSKRFLGRHMNRNRDAGRDIDEDMRACNSRCWDVGRSRCQAAAEGLGAAILRLGLGSDAQDGRQGALPPKEADQSWKAASPGVRMYFVHDELDLEASDNQLILLLRLVAKLGSSAAKGILRNFVFSFLPHRHQHEFTAIAIWLGR